MTTSICHSERSEESLFYVVAKFTLLPFWQSKLCNYNIGIATLLLVARNDKEHQIAMSLTLLAMTFVFFYIL